MLIFQVLFSIVIIFDLILCHSAHKQRTRSANALTLTVFFAALTALFYLLSISFGSYFPASLFSSFVFICIDFILINLLHFSVIFTKFKIKPQTQIFFKYLLLGLAVLDSLVLLVNPFHEIALTYAPHYVYDTTIYQYVPHFLYSCHLAFCYCLLAIIIFILICRCIRTPAIYMERYIGIVFSITLTVLLNLLFLIGKEYFSIDISILFYSLCAALLYYNVFHSIRKNTLIVTRQLLMDNLGRAIIFFDYEDYFIDCNEKMRVFFSSFTQKGYQPNFQSFLAEYQMPPLNDKNTVFEWHRFSEGLEHNYRCEFYCIKDKHMRVLSKIMIIEDISYSKDTITGLDLTSGLARYLTDTDFSKCYPIQMLVFNVNGLGIINNALGHDKGNQVMLKVVENIRHTLGPDVYLAKLEDGSIIAVLKNTESNQAITYADAICHAPCNIQPLNFQFNLEYGLAEANLTKHDVFSCYHEALDSMKNRKMLNDNAQGSSLIHSLSQTLLESDYETEAHVQRTQAASEKLGLTLGLSHKSISELAILSRLHDIGKIGIPQSILLKPDKLTSDEWMIMQSHAEKGYRIAKASPELEPIADLILHHHERFDGNGYPGHLKGDEIPLLSRIITVIDSYDVMIHDRPYHKAMSEADAQAELIRCSGTQFDPQIVKAYLGLLNEAN